LNDDFLVLGWNDAVNLDEVVSYEEFIQGVLSGDHLFRSDCDRNRFFFSTS